MGEFRISTRSPSLLTFSKVNCANHLHANVPFGGYKQSGIGRELGQDVLRKYVPPSSFQALQSDADGVSSYFL